MDQIQQIFEYFDTWSDIYCLQLIPAPPDIIESYTAKFHGIHFVGTSTRLSLLEKDQDIIYIHENQSVLLESMDISVWCNHRLEDRFDSLKHIFTQPIHADEVLERFKELGLKLATKKGLRAMLVGFDPKLSTQNKEEDIKDLISLYYDALQIIAFARGWYIPYNLLQAAEFMPDNAALYLDMLALAESNQDLTPEFRQEILSCYNPIYDFLVKSIDESKLPEIQSEQVRQELNEEYLRLCRALF